jgi:levansucrase
MRKRLTFFGLAFLFIAFFALAAPPMLINSAQAADLPGWHVNDAPTMKSDSVGQNGQSLAVARQDGTAEVSSWLPEAAMGIQPVPEENTVPPFMRDDLLPDQYSPDQWTFETWPLMRPGGELARVDGYFIFFSLAVPDGSVQDPEDRYEQARIRYYYSQDGMTWTDGGELFPEGDALGDAQWAGSAVIDDCRLRIFYTAVGEIEPDTPDGDGDGDGDGTDTPECPGGSVRQNGECPPDGDGDGDGDGNGDGDVGEPITIRSQSIALAEATLTVGPDGPSFDNWSEHEVILEPDGMMYQTAEQAEQQINNQDNGNDDDGNGNNGDGTGDGVSDGDSQQGIAPERTYAFRDPFFFTDPESGNDYIIFSGDLSPDFTLADDCENRDRFNAAVGIARLDDNDDGNNGDTDGDGTSDNGDTNGDSSTQNWTLLPPLFHASCITKMLDQPHLIFRDNLYHLFANAYSDSFAPDIQGWTALYGFTSEELFGQYTPINESGLVLGNPESAPLQSYGRMTTPDLTVLSFALYPEVEAERVDELTAQERFDAFAGTLAPAAQLQTPDNVADNTTQLIVGEVCEPGTFPCPPDQADDGTDDDTASGNN